MMFSALLIKYRRPLIILVHAGLVCLAYYISFALRFEFVLQGPYLVWFYETVVWLLLIKLLVYGFSGIYYGLWRYVSANDVWQIVKANSVAAAVFLLFVVFTRGTAGFPRSIFILDWLLSNALVAGIRMATRLFRERFKPALPQKKRKALIIGAGQAGILMLKESRNNPDMGLDVRGFIDDDPLKWGQRIDGIKVFGGRTRIAEVVSRLAVEELVLAIPSAKGEVIRDIITHCQIPGVSVKTVPALEKLVRGGWEFKIRDVEPEDLLGREMIKVDCDEIKTYLRGKTVLVTGAGGSIGSELCRQIAAFEPKQLLLLDHNENDVYFLELELRPRHPGVRVRVLIGDIKDVGFLQHVFSSLRPQVVFHAAAHKHVPLMQDNPLAAVKNNIIGTRNLVYASHHYLAERFVFISTDKAVNPVNIMGLTKRIAEMIIQAKAQRSRTKFMAVRFGNVLGSAGSVVPLFKKQIREGGPVTVTHPQAQRYFMCISEAVSLVLQAGALGKGGEIFILDMGEQIKIVDIAKNLIALSGLKLDKDISISYVGLREAEKLSEELLLNIEKDRVTRNRKIYVTEPNHFDPKQLRRQIRDLERLARRMDERAVLKKLKEIQA